jgi:eukaryotic-like serine/threonine-protein kinase
VDTSTLSPFLRCGLAAGLLTSEAIDEVLAALRWSDRSMAAYGGPPVDQQIAAKLVELGRLNSWQAQQLLEGRTRFNLGNYWMIDWIGQGGMGQVFKAEDRATHRVVAVKVLPRSKSTPEAINDFLREVRAIERLDHPNLVRAIDYGEDGAVHFLVTEYVPGTDLRKLVRRHGPLSMTAAASIVSQVALGLEHAHQEGLIHRDVKPGNVLVTPEGYAKLSDFGLAGSLGGDAAEDPKFGKIVGTADYLCPDHIRDPQNPKPAWDIYSLGCTFYYAVTGKVPFPGGTVTDKARSHLDLTPLDPRRLNPTLSAEMVDVIADMMAKDLNSRITNAAEVVVRLVPWTGVPIASSPAEEHLVRAARAARLARQAGVAVAPGQSADHAEDTENDFSEMRDDFEEVPEQWPDWRDGQAQASQSTYPVDVSMDETFRVLADAQPESIAKPLAYLLLLPLGLAALVAILYGVVRSIF